VGTIAYSDLLRALQQLGGAVTPAVVQAIFAGADMWDEGRLTFREFLVCLALGHLLGAVPLNGTTSATPTAAGSGGGGSGGRNGMMPALASASASFSAGHGGSVPSLRRVTTGGVDNIVLAPVDEPPPSPTTHQVLALIREAAAASHLADATPDASVGGLSRAHSISSMAGSPPGSMPRMPVPGPLPVDGAGDPTAVPVVSTSVAMGGAPAPASPIVKDVPSASASPAAAAGRGPVPFSRLPSSNHPGILHTARRRPSSHAAGAPGSSVPGATPADTGSGVASKVPTTAAAVERRVSFTAVEARAMEGDTEAAAALAAASAAAHHVATLSRGGVGSLAATPSSSTLPPPPPGIGISATPSSVTSPLDSPTVVRTGMPPTLAVPAPDAVGEAAAASPPRAAVGAGASTAATTPASGGDPFLLLSSRRGTGDLNDPNLIAWAFHLCLEAFLQLSSGGELLFLRNWFAHMHSLAATPHHPPHHT